MHIHQHSKQCLLVFLILFALFSCAQLSKSPDEFLLHSSLSGSEHNSLQIRAEVANSTKDDGKSNIGMYKFFDVLPVILEIKNNKHSTYILDRQDITLLSDLREFKAMNSEELRSLMSRKWFGIPKSFLIRDLQRGYVRWAIQEGVLIEPESTKQYYAFFRIRDSKDYDKIKREPTTLVVG